ncbi:EAL domain-containing protein [Aestuariibacter sp. A3R04]|uniref:sensor domain-containing protein n=1 Tax=Aestuariibacter sp. A3R04 TaxID=2841571 RepID=UPI001C09AFB8|nr:EAL domain-containing protein [Aestuariibacter sp. A3R04]MBU3022618.1 EAL domain-containing protein [Aestuariibacter sp. A3R04]
MKLQKSKVDVTFESHDLAERRFVELISGLPKVSVQGYDKNRRVIYWNQSSEHIYGFTEQEALGQKLENLIIPEFMRSEVVRLHTQWLEKGEPIPSEDLVLVRKDGAPVHVFSSHVMLKQDTESPEMFCVDIDLSEQIAIRNELERMASTDLLTNLPNRRHLNNFLSDIITQARESQRQFAIFFIDLDMFKEVNDTLGHTWGDSLLKGVAKRLQDCVAGKGELARFGGDEFVLVLPAIDDDSQITAMAEHLMACFKSGFLLGCEHIRITASVGVSVFPRDGDDVVDLLKNADNAMYQAKLEGRNRFNFFTSALSQRLLKQRTIASKLHDALVNEELTLYFQPQVDLCTGLISACEALLRWYPRGENTPVPPDVFIPIAERTDLIKRIGHWVLDKACQQSQIWKQKGLSVRIDINVSGRELEDVNFFASLDACRKNYGLAPEDIGIELTENVLIRSQSEILEGLTLQRQKGVEISIDDFGTGYSSLSYLKQFPVSKLKIDRSFLKDAPENDFDGALMEAMINVGHKLHLAIVAEGVETQKQASYCNNLKVEYVQGYLYSKPVAAMEMEALLRQNKALLKVNR